MYSYKDRIGFSRVGEDDCLSLGGLVDYFQDSSNFQSEDLGIGVEALLKEDSCWILLSWQVVINEYPKSSQPVILKTWPHAFKGFLGNRNYVMETEEGRVLAYANSIWTYADNHTGKPKKVQEGLIKQYFLKDSYPMDYTSRKVRLPEEMELIGEYCVTRSVIDTNHHMNNSRYVYLASDYLPAERRVKQFRVEYRQASRLGETLLVYRGEQDGKCLLALKGEEGEMKTAMEIIFA